MKGFSLYNRIFKRCLDFSVALIATLVTIPVFLLLMVLGFVFMKGNPFFIQPRPGLNEKVFKLYKFRTMTNDRGVSGELLPDENRLNKYGLFLRKTSLDELPQLINIIKGDLSFIGPRPLLVKYLDRYSEEQHRRHDVRPGLTGYAQVNGRNLITWEEKFKMDVWYTRNVNFNLDVKIFIDTIKSVFKREGISSNDNVTMNEFLGNSNN